MADSLKATSGGSAVKFISWNVKGLNGPVKRGRIFSHLKNLKTDIAFLQETHLRNRSTTFKKAVGGTNISF